MHNVKGQYEKKCNFFAYFLSLKGVIRTVYYKNLIKQPIEGPKRGYKKRLLLQNISCR